MVGEFLTTKQTKITKGTKWDYKIKWLEMIQLIYPFALFSFVSLFQSVP